jgi:hypothetical protein
LSSNVSQNYPYSRETEQERAAAVAKAFDDSEGLEDRVVAEASPLGDVEMAENGAPIMWWTWVCPQCVEGRLHVVGYGLERHGLFTVCDDCGSTFTR